MSRGIINFYFTSKESMLKEVLLNLLATERKAVQSSLAANSQLSAKERLAALVEVLSSPRLYSKKRLSAWCAFAAFAASHAPTRYAFERNYQDTSTTLTELCREAGAASPVSNAAIAAGLVLATGSRPRTVNLPGVARPGVQVLRTLAESDQLKSALESGGPLVIYGGGWIGLEVAAAARTRDVPVTVVVREDPKT